MYVILTIACAYLYKTFCCGVANAVYSIFSSNIIKTFLQKQTSWLGVTDIENEGVLKYGYDESSLSWHNWNTQSGPIGNNEAMNCVKMDAEGIWQIDNCNNKLTFVCEGN